MPVMSRPRATATSMCTEDDPEMARRIAVNAKTQRPGVCNAAETLLVDAAIAERFLPVVLADLREDGVELVGDERTRALAGGVEVAPASAKDWDTEFLGLKMAVAVVDSVEAAVDTSTSTGPATRRRSSALTRKRPNGSPPALTPPLLHQRLDPLYRWLRVRDGSGDRQLDPEVARPRSDRDARADHLQVRRPRRRPSAWVAPSPPASASSGRPSTRRIWDTWRWRRRRSGSSVSRK